MTGFRDRLVSRQPYSRGSHHPWLRIYNIRFRDRSIHTKYFSHFIFSVSTSVRLIATTTFTHLALVLSLIYHSHSSKTTPLVGLPRNHEVHFCCCYPSFCLGCLCSRYCQGRFDQWSAAVLNSAFMQLADTRTQALTRVTVRTYTFVHPQITARSRT